jgi:hypothetical protein
MYIQNNEINNSNIKVFLQLLSKAVFSAKDISLFYTDNLRTIIYDTNDKSDKVIIIYIYIYR